MDGKGVLFVVFFLKFSTIFLAPPPATPTMKSGKHLHLFVMLQASFGFTRDPMFCNFHASIGYCYVCRFFWSCYHRLSLHPWLKALSTCDFQSPKVLLWPMGVGGIRPRSQGGKCRGLVNFVEIHEGGRDGIFPCRVGTSLCASWFLNMKPCVSGYNLITCFLKSMWKSLQAVPWGSWNHHLILLELICFKTSRSCFSQVVAFGVF